MADDLQQFWCSTEVDHIGTHVTGQWGVCSKDCNGVYVEASKKKDCDTEEPGVQCSIPFSVKGYQYFGCIKSESEKYWCPVKDETKGFRKVNCLKSCPTDVILSTVKLSTVEIIKKLKTTPKVYSMIESDGNCEEGFETFDMNQV